MERDRKRRSPTWIVGTDELAPARDKHLREHCRREATAAPLDERPAWGAVPTHGGRPVVADHLCRAEPTYPRLVGLPPADSLAVAPDGQHVERESRRRHLARAVQICDRCARMRGALTQCVVPVRRIWLCSLGTVAWILLSIDSFGIATMIAAGGANLWCMWAKVPAESTTVPPARAQ